MASVKNNFIKELQWRGMIHDVIPGTEECLAESSTRAYVGYEPTGKSLHIGNLATIMLLSHFQKFGHQPIALLGGATGMVGDPSGKNEERKLLSREELIHNQDCIKNQLSKFLDLDKGKYSGIILNNYDWFKDVGFLDFIRDIGKHFSINYMMAKDSVKARLETGISFTEFSYQLLQGFDFYYLYRNHDVKMQMGGADQWGNLTSGVELIRKKLGEKAFALTTPLVTKSDGSKFGKTAGGAIWLDPNLTSPYKLYQYFLNTTDEEASRLIKIFSLLTEEDIEQIIHCHHENASNRLLQHKLAEEVTTLVHSGAEARKAIKASKLLFSDSFQEAINQVDESTLLIAFEGIPRVYITESAWEEKNTVLTFITATTKGEIISSKSEARRMIEGGGIRINQQKITDVNHELDVVLIHNKYLLIQKGKKNYYVVVVEK